MTTITGKFVDSGGVTFDGDLTLTLDAPLVDVGTTPDSIYTLSPHVFTFTAGTLSGVNVVESATSNVTYRFVVNRYTTKTTYWLPDGTQYDGPVVTNSGNYYTGTFYDAATSQRLGQVTSTESTVVMDFHAILPNAASIEFASLIPSRISTDSLPRTIRAIAELLTTDADFVEALRGGPRFKGAYSGATYYQRDDSVTYGGSSWVYINADPAVNQTPSLVNTTYWQILAQKGDPGGTGGNDTAYDATGWNGATDAPSRNAVRDILEQKVSISALSSYALLASPVLITPTRTTSPSVGDRSLAIPTTNWVGSEIARVGFSSLKTNDQTITTDVLTALAFNQELLDSDNAFNSATATFTAPKTAWYEFNLGCRLEAVSTITRFLGLVIVGVNQYVLWELAGSNSLASSGFVVINLAAGQTAQFQIYASSGGTITNKNTYPNSYYTFCSGKQTFL
ncbi:MAG: complement C1q domain-containing protein [Desmonostoc geniculatum HA4340-LM1]|jgi:hypothetical protein|nr:complement C1q domain-containing protein [Desmonostoc geniculatum HA4340-LM1]